MTAKQRREAALLKQQAIVNAARMDGNRALTAEEQAEFDGYQREIEQADAEINAQERGLAGGTGASTAPPAAVLASPAPQMHLQVTGYVRGLCSAAAQGGSRLII